MIAARRGDAYEFGDLRGIRPSSTDFIVDAGESIVLHGEYDGYVYRQESGNDFDGNVITGKYRSPDLSMGDAGIRKNFQRVIINYAPEAAVNADLLYDTTTSRRTQHDQRHIRLIQPQWLRCMVHRLTVRLHTVDRQTRWYDSRLRVQDLR